MAITYDAGTNIITVNNQAVSTEDIDDADDAGGWGVVHENTDSEEKQYTFACRVILTNGASWIDNSVQIVFSSTASASYQNLIQVETGCTLTFGTLIDAVAKTTYQGVVVRTNRNSQVQPIYGAVGSTVNLYGCLIQTQNSYSLVRIYGSGQIYETMLDGCYLTNRGGAALSRVTIRNGRYGLFEASGSYEDLVIHNPTGVGGATALYGAYNYVGDMKYVVIKSLGAVGMITLTNLNTNWNLINVESEAWTFTWAGTCTANVNRQYEFNRKILDKEGNVYAGKAWTLKDKDGNTVESGTTQADGKLSATDLVITHGYYDQANGDTEQLSSPFTLTVTGDADNSDLTLLNLPIDTKDVTGIETMPTITSTATQPFRQRYKVKIEAPKCPKGTHWDDDKQDCVPNEIKYQIIAIPVTNEKHVKAVERKFDKKWEDLQKETEKKKRLRSDLDMLKVIQDLETLENM